MTQDKKQVLRVEHENDNRIISMQIHCHNLHICTVHQ